jgi:hypothetical protein
MEAVVEEDVDRTGEAGEEGTGEDDGDHRTEEVVAEAAEEEGDAGDEDLLVHDGPKVLHAPQVPRVRDVRTEEAGGEDRSSRIVWDPISRILGEPPRASTQDSNIGS